VIESPADPHPSNTGLASERVRARMVERVRELGVRDARVLAVLGSLRRHVFVDPALSSRAYEDSPLPIGLGQTISQPYIVARSAEWALQACADPARARVLEVGTGCGYAAAFLACLFGTVLSIERLRELHEQARANLRPLRVANLRLLHGDGMLGVPAQAPFDAIVAAAAGETLPSAWSEQLAIGGCIVAPIGDADQRLTLFVKEPGGRLRQRHSEPVRFVPLRPGTQ